MFVFIVQITFVLSYSICLNSCRRNLKKFLYSTVHDYYIFRRLFNIFSFVFIFWYLNDDFFEFVGFNDEMSCSADFSVNQVILFLFVISCNKCWLFYCRYCSSSVTPMTNCTRKILIFTWFNDNRNMLWQLRYKVCILRFY